MTPQLCGGHFCATRKVNPVPWAGVIEYEPGHAWRLANAKSAKTLRVLPRSVPVFRVSVLAFISAVVVYLIILLITVYLTLFIIFSSLQGSTINVHYSAGTAAPLTQFWRCVNLFIAGGPPYIHDASLQG